MRALAVLVVSCFSREGDGLEVRRLRGVVVMERKRGKTEKAGGEGSGRSMMAWMPSPPTGDLPPRLPSFPSNPGPIVTGLFGL